MTVPLMNYIRMQMPAARAHLMSVVWSGLTEDFEISLDFLLELIEKWKLRR